MRAQTSDRTFCQKSGYILTCYMDGRKRFRALRIDGDVEQESMNLPERGSEISGDRVGFASRRNQRPS